MNDNELLMLAAKAAGIDFIGWDAFRDDFAAYDAKTDVNFRWNPLTDDGDALRLAFVLKIDMEWQNVGTFPEPAVEAYRRHVHAGIFCASEHENDYRRAIVCAAAQIGKAMP